MKLMIICFQRSSKCMLMWTHRRQKWVPFHHLLSQTKMVNLFQTRNGAHGGARIIAQIGKFFIIE